MKHKPYKSFFTTEIIAIEKDSVTVRNYVEAKGEIIQDFGLKVLKLKDTYSFTVQTVEQET